MFRKRSEGGGVNLIERDMGDGPPNRSRWTADSSRAITCLEAFVMLAPFVCSSAPANEGENNVIALF